MIAILILAVGLTVPVQQMDAIEVNHFCNESGSLRFAQVIYWRWSPDYRRMEPRGWHIIRDLNDYPTKRGGIWYHRDKRAAIYRETWTLYDRELRRRCLATP